MRDVTENYLAQVKSCARQFGFRVDVYGNSAEEPDTLLSDIISIDITRSASDQLQIGACMSSKLTLQTRATTLLNGRGKKVVVYYRCTTPLLGWDKLGTFYVEKCVTEQGITAVTAYDMMSRLDKRVSWVDTSHARLAIGAGGFKAGRYRWLQRQAKIVSHWSLRLWKLRIAVCLSEPPLSPL